MFTPSTSKPATPATPASQPVVVSDQNDKFIDSLKNNDFSGVSQAKATLDKIYKQSEKIPDKQLEFLENALSKVDFLTIEYAKHSTVPEMKKNLTDACEEIKKKLIELNPEWMQDNEVIFKGISNQEQADRRLDGQELQQMKGLKIAYYQNIKANCRAPIKNNQIINAAGVRFNRKNDNVSNGNCGLDAVYQATNPQGTQFDAAKERETLVRCQQAYRGIKNEQLLANSLMKIFNGTDRCKNYFIQSIKAKLQNPDVKSRDFLESLLARLNNFDGVSIADLCDDSDLREYVSSNMDFEFSTDSGKDGTWLHYGDILLLMLNKGYILQNTSLGTAQSDAKVVLEFRHLTNESTAYIANNASMAEINSTTLSGSHWFCVTRADTAAAQHPSGLSAPPDNTQRPVPTADEQPRRPDATRTTPLTGDSIRPAKTIPTNVPNDSDQPVSGKSTLGELFNAQPVPERFVSTSPKINVISRNSVQPISQARPPSVSPTITSTAGEDKENYKQDLDQFNQSLSQPTLLDKAMGIVDRIKKPFSPALSLHMPAQEKSKATKENPIQHPSTNDKGNRAPPVKLKAEEPVPDHLGVPLMENLQGELQKTKQRRTDLEEQQRQHQQDLGKLQREIDDLGL